MTADPLELMAQVLRSSLHRFVGRLGKDPEIRYFEGGSCVAQAGLAVDRPDKRKNDGQEPDWFRIEFWGEHAQAFADAYRKGDMVDVTGRVKVDRWTNNQTGEINATLVIKAEGIAKLRAAGEGGQGQQGGAATQAAAPAQQVTTAPVQQQVQPPVQQQVAPVPPAQQAAPSAPPPF